MQEQFSNASKQKPKRADQRSAAQSMREREVTISPTNSNNNLFAALLTFIQRLLAEGKLLPETCDDFERLLVAQPNSSFLWVQYIAFYLQQVDVDAARTVANRALRTIHYREDDVNFDLNLPKVILILFKY